MGVRFTSTRDPSIDVSFKEAVILGQPEDGGLFVPAQIPHSDLQRWSPTDPLAAIARAILPDWIGDDAALDVDFEAVFSIPVPRIDLGTRDDEFEGISVVELFHGPTGSFKDFGARFLAAVVSAERRRSRRPAVVVVATSGDTGSAVAEAFSGIPGLVVVVLYPKDGVSAVQEAQLTRSGMDGVYAYAVEGSFDDCQAGAKSALAEGNPAADILSANSINIGRLLPQMLFYLKSAAIRGETPFVVPCGNLGNLTAGLLARSGALPAARFVAVTNTNDYFVRFIEAAEADLRDVRKTLSNAMDVSRPSNLERITSLFSREELSTFLSAESVDDETTRQTMLKTYESTGYVADPHTSVALTAALRRGGGTVIATADPSKYRELVLETTRHEVNGSRFRADNPSPVRVITPDDIPAEIDHAAKSLN